MDYIRKVQCELFPLKRELNAHPLYTKMNSIKDIRIFAEIHIFAVWDFMSLLKSLQHQLSTLSLPWVPAKNPKITRFINEIVIGEESDLDADGCPKSHFEMYIDAMNQIEADTSNIKAFIQNIQIGVSISDAIKSLKVQKEVKDFLIFTFDVIATNQPHKIASAFTFGREDIIPDMFIEIVKNIEEKSNIPCDKIIYYLNRHIEIDGDEHGPLSLEMIQLLCEYDATKWQECIDIAKESLKLRISLWDTVLQKLSQSHPIYA